jgi:SAM-dependent methyltransferase
MTAGDKSMVSSHWEKVWTSKSPESTSWFEPTPTHSLELIHAHTTYRNSVIDIGGGGSPLANCLYQNGYRDVSVLDISDAALGINRVNFGADAHVIDWIVADIVEWSPARTYDLWHDRAVFHFLISDAHVARYAATCAAAVAPGGLIVIGTFGPNGPETCSGLAVKRRTIAALSGCFADNFVVVQSSETEHVTPNGTTQEFVSIVAQRALPILSTATN